MQCQIIATSRDPYVTNNPIHLRYHKLNSGRGRMSGQVRIRVRYEMYVGKWFDYLIVSREEMEQILLGTGWKIREFLNSGGPQYAPIIAKIREPLVCLALFPNSFSRVICSEAVVSLERCAAVVQ
jgi:hypothetical protein